MSKQLRLIFLCCLFASHLFAQSWSQKMATTVMTIWKDSLEMAPGKPVKWAYDQGVVLEGIEGLWTRTADNRYFEYIQKSMDYFVQEDGTIRSYRPYEYNIDHVKNGRSLLLLYKVTGKSKYLKAVQSYMNVARKGYNGIIKEFMKTDAGGLTNLKGTVSVAGLGGNPYRDGSYKYYLSEKVIVNNPKGVGAFLLASNEMEIASMPKSGKGKTVMLDNYFNNETVKNDISAVEPFHYLWDEKDNNGFYLLGQVFKNRGASINTLKVTPDAGNLKNADIYIIVDPDSKKETAEPNYIEAGHIKTITDWVKAGGTLLLMGNDSGNMEFEYFNKLAEAFGIHFNENSKNRVPGSEYQYGKIVVPSGHPVFKTVRQLYMKEVSSLTLKSPAKAVLDHKGDIFIAVAKSGKGIVLAVGDPWLYNEYTDGRKLPAKYENFKAAEDLAEWLFKQ